MWYKKVFYRITGLDPARALFEGTLAIKNGLDRTCAKFVDIIHTNPGYYGTSKPSGTVDLWPNYSPSDGMQPGCPSGTFQLFSSGGKHCWYKINKNFVTNLQLVLLYIKWMNNI